MQKKSINDEPLSPANLGPDREGESRVRPAFISPHAAANWGYSKKPYLSYDLDPDMNYVYMPSDPTFDLLKEYNIPSKVRENQGDRAYLCEDDEYEED